MISGRGALPVVVLDWNGGAETLDCLAAVYASEGIVPEVTLVDNASSRPVVEEARQRFPSLRVLRNGENRGYAGGNNVGLRAALDDGAESVVLLNNDAIVAPDALRALSSAVAPGVAAVGARILRREDPSRLWMAWGDVTYRQSLVRLVGQGQLDDERFRVARDVAWVSGCGWLLTREGLERVGLLDEDYFAYHEEVDWCARAREAGLRIVYEPSAAVRHRGEGSSGGSYVSRKQYLVARNMVRFVRRHASVGERLRFVSCVAATLPLQFLRRALRGEQEGVRLKVRGFRDALLDRPIPRAELGLDA